MTEADIARAAEDLIMAARPYADNPTERTRNAFYIVGVCALMDALTIQMRKEAGEHADVEAVAADHPERNGGAGDHGGGYVQENGAGLADDHQLDGARERADAGI